MCSAYLLQSNRPFVTQQRYAREPWGRIARHAHARHRPFGLLNEG